MLKKLPQHKLTTLLNFYLILLNENQLFGSSAGSDLQAIKIQKSIILSTLLPHLPVNCHTLFLLVHYLHYFLHDVIIKLFYRSKQNNFLITSCKNWGFQGNSANSTNNLMSSFSLSEENMELTLIY